MLTKENYEEWLMMAADGELDTADMEVLSAFLKAHPVLAAEAEAWQALKLVPDAGIHYPQQSRLMRGEHLIIPFYRSRIAWTAAAAVLLCLLSIPFLQQRAEQIAVAVPIPQMSKIPAPATQNTDPIHDSTIHRRITARQTAHIAAARGASKSPSINTPLPAAFQRLADSILPSLTPARSDIAFLVAAPAHQYPVESLEVPAGADFSTSPDNASFIRLAGANAEAYHSLLQSLRLRIGRAEATAKSVKSTSFVVRLRTPSTNF